MRVFGILLSEYKSAKERIKYAPGGDGYYEAMNQFEKVATLTKKRCLEKDIKFMKVQKKM